MSVLVGEGGPQINKFEQLSNDGHQMSLAGKAGVVGWGERQGQGWGSRLPCLMPGGGGGLYSEIQCIMGNGHTGTPFPHEKTDRHK